MLDLHRGQLIGLGVDVWALGCLLFSLAYRRPPAPQPQPQPEPEPEPQP